MSYIPAVSYCPYRTNIGHANVQFSDFSHIQYFQQSESEVEDEVADEVEGEDVDQHQGEPLKLSVPHTYCMMCKTFNYDRQYVMMGN